MNKCTRTKESAMHSIRSSSKPCFKCLARDPLLDVGTATGFRLIELRSALPGAFVLGVEHDVPASTSLIRGGGLALLIRRPKI
jgi:hypothetical protein